MDSTRSELDLMEDSVNPLSRRKAEFLDQLHKYQAFKENLYRDDPCYVLKLIKLFK